MARIKWTDFRRGLWLVGPSETSPEGTVRRATGAGPLRTIALRSRSGTLSFYSLDAHSMARYNGFYFFGDGTNLTRSANANPLAPGSTTVVSAGVFDGTRLTFVQMPPTAGIADYLFVAGGGNLKKTDPAFGAVTEWGIAPPDYTNGASPDFAAALPGGTEVTIDNLNDIADATTWTDPGAGADYTLQNDTTRFTQGGASMRFNNITKDRRVTAQIDHTASPLDLTDIGGGPGTSDLDDRIVFQVRINRPKNVESISLTFDVDSGVVALFGGKTVSHEFRVETVRKRRRAKKMGLGDRVKGKDESKELNRKKDKLRDRTYVEDMNESVLAVTRRQWKRVALSKAAFQEGGEADEDVDWATVRAIQFEVTTNKQGSAAVNFDFLRLRGGAGMLGDYQYHVTFRNSTTGTRSNPDLTAGPITVENVERESVSLTGIPVSADTQVDQREIWRTIGNGEVFFLAFRIEDNVTTTALDDTNDYVGFKKRGGSETYLDPTQELPFDNLKPDDTFEDAVGPHVGRMWWTRNTATGERGRVYFSPSGRAEAVAGFIEVASEEDEPQKLVIWNEQLWCFTKRKVFRIVGVEEPFLFTEVWGAPGTQEPFTVVPTPAGILYRAQDGVRAFDGQFSRVIGEGDPLRPLFRNGTPDGFPVTFVGDYAAYGRGEYYLTDSRDADRTMLAVDVETGAWRNLGFPSNFLFYDEKANVLFGRNVPSTVGDAMVIHSSTHGGTFSLAAFMKPGGPSSLQSTDAAARALAPRAFTITRLTGHLGSALTGGQTAAIQFYIDGVADPGIVLNYTSADSAGVGKSATGTVEVSSGQTISIGVTLGGGAASVQMRSLAYAYEVPIE